ncbi:MAG: DsbA family protein [Sandaracinaceae bacterium]|nr:DsbA family protein [Sandaracinaceae bacterium]
MTLRSRLVGQGLATYLAWQPRLRGGRDTEVFFQPDDPYSYLLAQLLPELRDRYRVPAPLQVVLDPVPEAQTVEPEVLLAYAIADCVELARYYELDFPADAVAPSRDVVERAASALMMGVDPVEVGAAVWGGRGGDLPAARPGTVERAHGGSDRLRRQGHYLGGMLRVGGQFFWGVDRLGLAEVALGGVPSLLRRRPESAWPEPDRGADGVDFWFSFRSPYSYLALERTLALPTEVRVKPVLPLVMRGMKVPRAKRLYIVHDAKREADRLGIPFGRICDPLGVGVERCLALYPFALAEGRAGELVTSAMTGIWSEALDVADDRDLRRIVERAGLRWTDARAALADPSWRERVETNRRELMDLGLWGVPSYQLGGYRVTGQDRLWILRAKIAGAPR